MTDLLNLIIVLEKKASESHSEAWNAVKELATLKLTKQLFLSGVIEDQIGDAELIALEPSLTELYLSLRGLESVFMIDVLHDFREKLITSISSANVDDNTEHSAFVSPEDAHVKLETFPWLIVVFLYRYYLLTKE